jgi:hypothetical protein
MTSSFSDPYDYELTHQNYNETTTMYQNMEPNDNDPIVVNSSIFHNDPLVPDSTSNPPIW